MLMPRKCSEPLGGSLVPATPDFEDVFLATVAAAERGEA